MLLRVAAAALALPSLPCAQLVSHDIAVAHPAQLPGSIAPISRVALGVRGDYKPYITQLRTGELLLVHRCSPQQEASGGEAGCSTEHAVLWRSPPDGSRWVRTQHVVQRQPPAPDLVGSEWSVFTFHDGTVFMMAPTASACTYYISKDHAHSFVANSTFNCSLLPGPWNGPSKAVIEVLPADAARVGVPEGVYLFGGNEMWRSVDSGQTFRHFKTVTNERWKVSTTDNFFEQSGTPFLTRTGSLMHAPRVGVNPIWDNTDGSQLFRSTDFGSSFVCTTNAAGGFCARNSEDRVFYPAPQKKHWSCPGGERPYACADLNASFGGPGDMYPSMLQLRDGRVLLTFTKRCNPAFPPMWSSTAGVPPPDPASGYSCECSNGRLGL